MSCRFLLLVLVCLVSFRAPAVAAPAFEGLVEALPAPRAAVLRWERASGDDRKGSVTYRIYQRRSGESWNFANPAGEVSGTDWAITDLQAGQDYEFLVRARDAGGEDQNTRSIVVRPTNAFPAEEFRGAWVSRFEWTKGSRADIEARLSQMMATLGAGNLNAVVFQVRGQGDTLYPSAEEPWSPLLKGDARSGDPIAHSIAEAHRNGIEFHAWFNLSVIWQSGAEELPTDPNHPFFRFADARDPQKCLGLIHDSSGKPKQWGSDKYVWLTHGNPEVNAYLRRQIVAFLAKHDVDGIHFDDRTGNPNGVSRDPVSIRRFEGRGNPIRIGDLGEWQRDQLARFLSDLYVVAKARDQQLLVTSSPFGIADRNRMDGYSRFSDTEKFGVEPEKWLTMGIMDALIPQVYWDMPDPEPNYGALVRDWVSHNRTGRPIWPGSALGKYGDVQPLQPMQVRYIALTRALGLNGNNFYNFTGANPDQWRSLTASVYPNKARVPVPSHLKPGTFGQIMGTVTDASGRPVVDCWVAVSGRKYTYLTSADGFFGIPNLAPGEYTVFFSRKEGEILKQPVTVVADKTMVVDYRLP